MQLRLQGLKFVQLSEFSILRVLGAVSRESQHQTWEKRPAACRSPENFYQAFGERERQGEWGCGEPGVHCGRQTEHTDLGLPGMVSDGSRGLFTKPQSANERLSPGCAPSISLTIQNQRQQHGVSV